MLDLTWKVFTNTGNIETYLLMKEIEKENQETTYDDKDELAELDYPLS